MHACARLYFEKSGLTVLISSQTAEEASANMLCLVNMSMISLSPSMLGSPELAHHPLFHSELLCELGII